jgi:hypothetical protein
MRELESERGGSLRAIRPIIYSANKYWYFYTIFASKGIWNAKMLVSYLHKRSMNVAVR